MTKYTEGWWWKQKMECGSGKAIGSAEVCI